MSHVTCSRECMKVWGSEPSHSQGASTLGVGVPMDSWSFRKWFQGSKPIGLKRATYCWKALNEGYNFAFDLISIEGLHAKLWGPKVARVQTLGISELPFRSTRTKCHLDVGLAKKHKVYYKGEGGGFPQVRAVVSLMSSSLLVACPSTKVLQLCIN